MNKLLILLATVLTFTLSGCNGSSGDNPQTSSESAVAGNIAITLLDEASNATNSFNADQVITVQVKVTDSANRAIANKRVNVVTDLGQLNSDSKLTDAQGVAELSINNGESALGAGTLVATADSLSSEKDYEFIQEVVETGAPSLALSMSVNGISTSQFKADELAQIAMTLLDKDGQPIVNELINLTADVGILADNINFNKTVLTNSSGKATTSLSGIDINGTELLGAGAITATAAQDNSITNRLNYQILPSNSDVIDDVRIGYFNDNNQFIEGEIKLSTNSNNISAGGTIGLSVDLVDPNTQRINAPTTVNFTSNCVANGKANIDLSVLSIKGVARATFEDISCAGSTGTEDVIIASVTTNGVDNSATTTIDISGDRLGSIEFISSEPEQIAIQGSGGQETSTVTFLVKSAQGNPLAQQEVTFSVDTDVGGVTLSQTSGFTNSQGQITTQVKSGTVPAVVRVNATAKMTLDDDIITVYSQSNSLSINTGLPEQTSMTMAASIRNPEASYVGTESEIAVWLADSFNNPVPDGTTVNFSSEGGSIEPSCTTVSGSCSVTWTATEPYLADHRSTILATAIGHETFFDTNGNNVFDDADGNAITNQWVDAGWTRHSPQSSGFVDMSEAWRDDNANGIKDAVETKFIDDNNNGVHDTADGYFNGPQCQGSKCDSNVKQATLRKSLELIMSDGDDPIYILSSSTQITTYVDNIKEIDNPLPSISDGKSLALKFRFADSAMQTMPFGTTVEITLDKGELTGTSSITIGNTSVSGFRAMDFIITNPEGGDSENATLTITIDTPNTLPTTYVRKTLVLN